MDSSRFVRFAPGGALDSASTRPIPHRPICGNEFEVIVVFTHARSTLAALKTAGRLAIGLGARIRLLAPHIVPYPVPLPKALVGTTCSERRFRTVVRAGRVDTRVEVRLCRNRWQMLRNVLPPQSVVVLGGRVSWWATAETRLSRKLRAAGHHVVFSLGE